MSKKLFAAGLLSIFFLTLLLLFLLIPLVKSYIFTQGYDARLFLVKDICEKGTQADILLIGSSTTVENINGALLEQLTNKTVYNLGIAGADPVLTSLFSNCFASLNASLIIYSFVQSNFVDTQVALEREQELFSLLSLFYPEEYALENAALLSEQQKVFAAQTSLKKYLFLRKYVVDLLFNGLKFITAQPSFEGYRGGAERYHHLKNPTLAPRIKQQVNETSAGVLNEVFFSGLFVVENNKNVQALSLLMSTLSKTNASLLLVHTPLHPFVLSSFNETTAKQFHATLQEQCTKMCVYENDASLFNQTAFFIDHVHLSEEGKTSLTKKLADSLGGFS